MIWTSEKIEKKCKYNEAIKSGVFLTRDLVSEPGNILHPDEYAKRLNSLKKHGLKVNIYDEKINPIAIVYLNRLSDLLFVIARYTNNKGKKDIHITTLEEHLKKYNELSNIDGNELKLFLNEDEAREHFNKVNN